MHKNDTNLLEKSFKKQVGLRKTSFALCSENAEEMALWRRGALLATEQLTFTMYKKD